MFGTHPFVRFLNQNRRQIRITIIIVILVFILIQILNKIAEKNLEKGVQDQNKYSVEAINENERQTFLKRFLNYCKEENESNAYALLSLNAKKIYKTEDEFKQKFISKYFANDKTYSINFVSENNEKYSYLVKIKEDILSTGKITQNQANNQFNIILEKQDKDYKIDLN